MASGQDQQHVFGLTFVLQPSREGFNNLTKCLDVLRTKWPSMDQQQEIIIHHFYFEVNSSSCNCQIRLRV